MCVVEFDIFDMSSFYCLYYYLYVILDVLEGKHFNFIKRQNMSFGALADNYCKWQQ